MDLFGMHQGYYDQVYGMPYEMHRHHHHSLGLEVLGGGAAFMAFKMYENRQRMNGHPMSHPGTKAALAALVGFEVTKLFQDNRYRHLDQEMVRMHAEQQIYMLHEQRYGGMGMMGGGMGMGGMGMGMGMGMGGMGMDPYGPPMGGFGGPGMYNDPYARPMGGYGMGGMGGGYGYGGGFF